MAPSGPTAPAGPAGPAGPGAPLIETVRIRAPRGHFRLPDRAGATMTPRLTQALTFAAGAAAWEVASSDGTGPLGLSNSVTALAPDAATTTTSAPATIVALMLMGR